MTKEDIKQLFQYNFWANKRILSTANQISTEELMKERSCSWHSIGGTLLHILDTEYGWRVLLKDGTSTPVWELKDFPDLAAIQAKWDAEETSMWDYLDSLSEDDLNAIFTREGSEESGKNKLWTYLVHLVNHGTQHRSECAMMLTDLGHSPGDIDFTVFLNTL